MVQLWSCLLLVLASLCVVHTKPYPDEKHRALLRTGYVHFPGGGYYRLAYKTPAVWAEARRQCQQEGATMAVVNSEQEAENLRFLYFNFGPAKVQRADWTTVDWDETSHWWYETTTEWYEPTTGTYETTTDSPPADATVHIGFHDIFIEGEYLTVRSEPIIMAGFIRWKVGHPIADDQHNCGGFDTGKFLLDIPCNLTLPYICEIPEAP